MALRGFRDSVAILHTGAMATACHCSDVDTICSLCRFDVVASSSQFSARRYHSRTLVHIVSRCHPSPRSLYASLAEHLARPSYSVYLFHLPIMTLIATWSALYLPSVVHHKWVAMLMISPLLYALCYLLYFAFEAHTERVRIAAGRLLGLSKTPRAPLSDRRPQAERIPAATAGRVPIR
jgi:hypothetical protein